MNDFLIWGANGHAKVLAELIQTQHLGRICALVDINPNVPSFIPNVPIFHHQNALLDFLNHTTPQNPWAGVVAIGGQNGNTRLNYLNFFKENGVLTPNLVHRSALLLSDIPHNAGIQILANATLGVKVQVGHAVILNSCVNVEHECILEDGVHLSPSATLCGVVHVGQNAWIGAASTVLPYLKIGRNALIGAGSVVTKNIPPDVIAKGNPARF